MDFKNTSDFVSGFWSMYVIVITLVSVLGCGLLLLLQDKAKTNAGQTTGHVWDETLEEYNNPLPNWWRWMFYITVVFSLVYLALYPGLGNMAGSFGWTMRGQYETEMKKADEQYGPIFKKFQAQDAQGTRGRDHTSAELVRETSLDHRGKQDRADRDHGCRRRTGNRGEQGAGEHAR